MELNTHDESLPRSHAVPHPPHASNTVPLFATPSHPRHLAPSPAHVPHASRVTARNDADPAYVTPGALASEVGASVNPAFATVARVISASATTTARVAVARGILLIITINPRGARHDDDTDDDTNDDTDDDHDDDHDGASPPFTARRRPSSIPPDVAPAARPTVRRRPTDRAHTAHTTTHT